MDIGLDGTHHLHLRTAGEGNRTFLLLHGWAVSGHIWDTLVDHWPAGAGPLLIPDLRGTGWSSKLREGYSLDDIRLTSSSG
jgi:pimeloyl-ACP methyl ester carboxylesterase